MQQEPVDNARDDRLIENRVRRVHQVLQEVCTAFGECSLHEVRGILDRCSSPCEHQGCWDLLRDCLCSPQPPLSNFACEVLERTGSEQWEGVMLALLVRAMCVLAVHNGEAARVPRQVYLTARPRRRRRRGF